MLFLEGLGTVVFGLWVMSHGTGPGESIMIVLGLPVVLFGLVLTAIGFAKSLKDKTPDGPDLGVEQSPKIRDSSPVLEDTFSFADSAERDRPAHEQKIHVRLGQKVTEQQPNKTTCPECGAKYSLVDFVAQPTMCSECWKKSRSSSIR